MIAGHLIYGAQTQSLNKGPASFCRHLSCHFLLFLDWTDVVPTSPIGFALGTQGAPLSTKQSPPHFRLISVVVSSREPSPKAYVYLSDQLCCGMPLIHLYLYKCGTRVRLGCVVSILGAKYRTEV